jgi:hypothetical protein
LKKRSHGGRFSFWDSDMSDPKNNHQSSIQLPELRAMK